MAVVVDMSSENEALCLTDACQTHPAITDYERGEIVCGGCGYVLTQNMLDISHESNIFSQEDYLKTARTGPATSLRMYDRGLSTMIGSDKDSSGNALSNKTKYEFNRLRTWDQRSKSRSNATLGKALTKLHGMKAKLNIPENVAEQAAYIYRKAVTAKLTRGRTMPSLLAAALYAACRENNIPRTLNDVVAAGNVEKKNVSRDLRTIIKKLDLNLNQYDTASFITKISNNLNFKEKTKREAFNILRRCEDKMITAGKHPMAQAAASLYIACLLNEEKTSQRKIAEEAGISDVTVRNRITLIKKTLKLV